jgi:hypothetical protein
MMGGRQQKFSMKYQTYHVPDIYVYFLFSSDENLKKYHPAVLEMKI